ncbi:hypothetical protein BRADI_5g24223v3 [Brachypodium distachyon]|uniref:Reverse transcriptase zinc-binding domain-containing protein n=1 Tax=Brachypodium distachyon TaxID=15368 RepID=A0A2K2CJ16_BRADI|nr:hypothetical protein BRADI_5g24223v3 [Brachypodium distachyon]
MKKGIDCDKWCSHCPTIAENGVHLFIDCSFARQVWNLVGSRFLLPPLSPPNWNDSTSVISWWTDRMEAISIGRTKAEIKGATSFFLLTLWDWCPPVWR